MRTRLATLVLLVAALLALAAPALAHVSVSTDSSVAGSFVKATLSVPHGCDGSPTTALRVRIPEGVTAVTPQVNPGWAIEVTEDGGEITEVAWTGGPLASDQLDEFGLSLKLPDDAAGEALHFRSSRSAIAGRSRGSRSPSPAARSPSTRRGRSW